VRAGENQYSQRCLEALSGVVVKVSGFGEGARLTVSVEGALQPLYR